MLDDGWTVVTADGTWAAHFEHTVAITADGPWVLTAAGRRRQRPGRGRGRADPSAASAGRGGAERLGGA